MAQKWKAWTRRAALKRAGLQLHFHNLRHACITKLAESQTSEQALMAIAGHLSRRRIEHYSHIRMQAKRVAMDAVVEGVYTQTCTKVDQRILTIRNL